MSWWQRFAEVWSDWRLLVQRDGWRAAWPHVRQEALTLPYRRLEYLVLARSLAEPLPPVQAKVPLEIRPFAPGDLDFVRQAHLPTEARLSAQRLAKGHWGITACVNGEVVGYAWSCADTSLEHIELPLEPGDVLLTDAFTAPVARGQGIQTALSLARLHDAQARGYQRAIAYIEVHNTPSLTVWQKKLGAAVIARFVFKRVGFWRRTNYRKTLDENSS